MSSLSPEYPQYTLFFRPNREIIEETLASFQENPTSKMFDTLRRLHVQNNNLSLIIRSRSRDVNPNVINEYYAGAAFFYKILQNHAVAILPEVTSELRQEYFRLFSPRFIQGRELQDEAQRLRQLMLARHPGLQSYLDLPSPLNKPSEDPLMVNLGSADVFFPLMGFPRIRNI